MASGFLNFHIVRLRKLVNIISKKYLYWDNDIWLTDRIKGVNKHDSFWVNFTYFMNELSPFPVFSMVNH